MSRNQKRVLTLLLVSLMAAAVCFFSSYVAAKILLRLRNGFGSGDLNAFLYWTSLFAVAFLFTAALFAIVMRKTRRIFRFLIGVPLGGLAGFGWTLLNLFLLGPWFGAWSFNVLYCWVAGGIVGMLPVAFLARARQLPQ